MTPPPDSRTLIERLRDEAALCRNETAEDVARLLDEAADALTARDELIGHLRCCVECSETSIEHCHEGSILWKAVYAETAGDEFSGHSHFGEPSR